MAKKAKQQLNLIINPDFEEKPKRTFTQHDLINVQAQTDHQKDFFRSYFKENFPIIAQVGSAGTGKTFIALYSALSEILTQTSDRTNIVIIRSAVQSRDIGFLKGSEEEKNEAYESPYVAICDDLLKYKTNNYIHLKEKELISFENTSFLRGKTLNNAVVIADEVQNMTYRELSTIVTRLGEGSRLVLCGDCKQTDLTKKGDVSGLTDLLKVLTHMKSACIIQYEPKDIVRSDLVKEFLMAEQDFGF